MRAVEAYFRTYGPAPADNVHYWLGNGLGAGRKRIQAWIAAFADRLAAVDIDGEPAYVMRDDLETLAGTRPNASVRLLPGFDQWLFGPGTADPHIVPPGKRGRGQPWRQRRDHRRRRVGDVDGRARPRRDRLVGKGTTDHEGAHRRSRAARDDPRSAILSSVETA